MSDNDIKPVAWVERNENGHDRMWSYSLESWANRPANPEPLYDQSAIDRLTEERDNYHEHLGDVVSRLQRAEEERDAAVADAERYRKIEALAAGTPEQWQAVEDAAFASHWGNVQNFALNIDEIDVARAEGVV